MKNFKQAIIILTVILFAGSTFTACSDPKEDEPNTPEINDSIDDNDKDPNEGKEVGYRLTSASGGGYNLHDFEYDEKGRVTSYFKDSRKISYQFYNDKIVESGTIYEWVYTLSNGQIVGGEAYNSNFVAKYNSDNKLWKIILDNIGAKYEFKFTYESLFMNNKITIHRIQYNKDNSIKSEVDSEIFVGRMWQATMPWLSRDGGSIFYDACDYVVDPFLLHEGFFGEEPSTAVEQITDIFGKIHEYKYAWDNPSLIYTMTEMVPTEDNYTYQWECKYQWEKYYY